MPGYFDDDAYFALDEESMAPGGRDTRLGGVPAWEQSATEGPEQPWTFVGQIASRLPMQSPPPDFVDPHPLWIATGWHLKGPNFGDDGIAYLFLDRSSDPPGSLLPLAVRLTRSSTRARRVDRGTTRKTAACVPPHDRSASAGPVGRSCSC